MSKHIDYEINRELGECYLFMGEYDKAADYYNKALACETGHADPFLGLATIAIQKGNLADARINYSMAVEFEPSDKAYAGLGLVEMECGEEHSAFENFISALKHNAGNLIAMNSLVQLGYKLGRLEEVLPLLHSALELDDNETVRFTLAGCLSYLGNTEEARAQLEILLGKNPGHMNAQELYAHIAA